MGRRGRKRNGSAIRRQPWWARRHARKKANDDGLTPREFFMRRLEAAGFYVKDVEATATALREMVANAGLTAISFNFPLDVLCWQNEQDEAAGMPFSVRRGISRAERDAGMKLAEMRYRLFGLPSTKGSVIGEWVGGGGGGHGRQKTHDDPEVEQKRQEREARLLQEYRDAMRALRAVGDKAVMSVVRTAIFWDMPNRADVVLYLRDGLFVLVDHFSGKKKDRPARGGPMVDEIVR